MITDIEEHLKVIRIDDDTYCVLSAVPIVKNSICIMMDKNQYNELLAIIPNIQLSYMNENKRGLWTTCMGRDLKEDLPILIVSCGAYRIFTAYRPSIDDVQKLYAVLKKGLNAPKLLWKDRDIFNGYKRCMIKNSKIIEVWKYENESGV